MRKGIHILISILLISVFGCTQNIHLRDLNKALIWNKAFLNYNIKIIRTIAEKNYLESNISLTNNDEEHLILIENRVGITQDKTDHIFSGKNMMIKGMYEIQPTPYRGGITVEANCTKDLKIDPKKIENEFQISYQYDLKATKYKVLGSCLEEDNFYLTQILLMYCKRSKEFFDIRYYYPKHLDKFVPPVATCNKI